jgi:hypothetical protein
LEQREDIEIGTPSTIHAFCIAVLLRNNGVGEFPRPFRMADDWETDKIVEPSLARRLGIQNETSRSCFQSWPQTGNLLIQLRW